MALSRSLSFIFAFIIMVETDEEKWIWKDVGNNKQQTNKQTTC